MDAVFGWRPNTAAWWWVFPWTRRASPKRPKAVWSWPKNRQPGRRIRHRQKRHPHRPAHPHRQRRHRRRRSPRCKAWRVIKAELGVRTVSGVSNVSFGLPETGSGPRRVLYGLAVYHGLDAAILNPGSARCSEPAGRLSAGWRTSSAKAISRSPRAPPRKRPPAFPEAQGSLTLTEIILRGLKDQAYAETMRLLETTPPLELIDKYLAAALNIVGAGFEKGEIFLPQLLLSAETVEKTLRGRQNPPFRRRGTVRQQGTIVWPRCRAISTTSAKISSRPCWKTTATRSSIWAGWCPSGGLWTRRREKDPPAGPERLMTTTVPAMEEVIRELAKGKIPCKVMVGGAVLTQTYADRIGGGFFTPKTPWAPFIAPKRSSAETNHR